MKALKRPGLVVALACMVWAFWFGRLAVMSWDGFAFGVFDVGIFHQGTWLLSEGLEPFVTLRGLHLFGDHASFILYLVAPLYWIWSDINVLVILAVVVPVAAGYITYRIGLAEGLKPWTSAALAFVFLLHPALAWTPWDSFHPEVFAILLIPAAYLAARQKRPLAFVVLSILLLLVKEDAVFVVIPLAAYVGLKWERLRYVAAGLILVGAGVAVLNFRVLLPGFSPTGSLIYSGRYTTDIVPLLTTSRLEYLVVMLIPAAIALRAPFLLAVAGPITAANLGSLHSYQHEIKWHYTAYLLGVLAAAIPVGMSKLVDRYGADVGVGFVSSARQLKVPVVAPLLALAALGFILQGPSLTLQGDWAPASASEQDEVYAALELIPEDAAVSASYTIAPHLAAREQVYMLPNPWIRDYYGVSEGVPPPPSPALIEWIVLDPNVANEAALSAIDQALAEGWVEVASGDRFVLYRAP